MGSKDFSGRAVGSMMNYDCCDNGADEYEALSLYGKKKLSQGIIVLMVNAFYLGVFRGQGG